MVKFVNSSVFPATLAAKLVPKVLLCSLTSARSRGGLVAWAIQDLHTTAQAFCGMEKYKKIKSVTYCLITSNHKILYNKIMWGKHPHQNKMLIFTTDKLIILL